MFEIGLIDADNTGFPNLALCKLYAWHKREGNRVWLNPSRELYDYLDLLYGSRVFSWSERLIEGVITGDWLADEIEHICPDFSLYTIEKEVTYGFTSRGCIRKCEFCQVWRREGGIKAWAHPSEFCREWTKKVVLMDNNWLAAPNFEETANYLIEKGVEVDPNQGLDIRLVTEKKAKILRQLKMKKVRFAFDSMEYKDELVRGVQTLRHWRVKPLQYECYVLHKPGDDALERIRILEGMYVDPFVMPYVDENGKRETSHLARWANAKQAYRKVPWEEYWYKDREEKFGTQNIR